MVDGNDKIKSQLPEDVQPETEVTSIVDGDSPKTEQAPEAETTTDDSTETDDFKPAYGITITANEDFTQVAVKAVDGLESSGEIPRVLLEQVLDRMKNRQTVDLVSQAIARLKIPMQVPGKGVQDIPYPAVIANQVVGMLMQAQNRAATDQQLIQQAKKGIIRP